MEYILDTNICIYIIKKKPNRVFNKFKSLELGKVGISAFTFHLHERSECSVLPLILFQFYWNRTFPPDGGRDRHPKGEVSWGVEFL